MTQVTTGWTQCLSQKHSVLNNVIQVHGNGGYIWRRNKHCQLAVRFGTYPERISGNACFVNLPQSCADASDKTVND
jgi:hypothetical protein